MKRIHHNQLWLTASEAAEFANRDHARYDLDNKLSERNRCVVRI